MEKHTSQKLCHFCQCCWDSEAILSKNVSSRSPGLNCSYGKNFVTKTEISVAKSEISVTEAARLLIWRNWIFFFPRKDLQCEISEIEPVQSTGLTWRSPLLRTPVGFIAQLVEHRTGIRGGHGFADPVEALIFQASSSQLLKLENLLRWSLSALIYNRSTNMNYFI